MPSSTAQGGPIELAIREEVEPHTALISVRDRGIGIPIGQQAIFLGVLYGQRMRAPVRSREQGLGFFSVANSSSGMEGTSGLSLPKEKARRSSWPYRCLDRRPLHRRSVGPVHEDAASAAVPIKPVWKGSVPISPPQPTKKPCASVRPGLNHLCARERLAWHAPKAIAAAVAGQT